MSHSRLGKLVLVYLRLEPVLLLCVLAMLVEDGLELTSIEDENVIDNSFLAISLSSAEDQQILSEL